MAICKRLVTMMDGEIGVSSRPGAGSTFAFTARLGKGQDNCNEHLVLPVDLRRMRVLVVDNNAIVRNQLCEFLISLSLEVEGVDSADAALTLMKKRKGSSTFDFILTDKG